VRWGRAGRTKPVVKPMAVGGYAQVVWAFVGSSTSRKVVEDRAGNGRDCRWYLSRVSLQGSNERIRTVGVGVVDVGSSLLSEQMDRDKIRSDQPSISISMSTEPRIWNPNINPTQNPPNDSPSIVNPPSPRSPRRRNNNSKNNTSNTNPHTPRSQPWPEAMRNTAISRATRRTDKPCYAT